MSLPGASKLGNLTRQSVYEQRMAKRDGESGELIRSDVQFSTEILKMREMFRGIQR